MHLKLRKLLKHFEKLDDHRVLAISALNSCIILGLALVVMLASAIDGRSPRSAEALSLQRDAPGAVEPRSSRVSARFAAQEAVPRAASYRASPDDEADEPEEAEEEGE